ncbi:PTS mannose/fructose/sorbose/N-acetylgalactosamine transporter subunit IIC [Lacticaseibacillus paracasei]|uniref:PTS mannose/fructose/sorbose/N-acetylgalactosamine transporter subunit IIC n=1 Tax=Lacticaseibacillus paracasei TaxID=1597 RepID=UPI003908B626
MHFTVIQIVLLTILAFIKHIDYYGIPMLFVNYPVFWGLFTGLLMGDMKTGLLVGGTVQLMSLGVAGFGGSSVPDYGTTAIIATAFGTVLGKDAGLAIGLPVGMLGVQLDVIVKILNGFVAKKAQQYANERKFKKMNAVTWLGPVFFGLSAAIPVFVSVTLGQSAVNFVLNSMPSWFMSGLTIAGKMLPAVGIAMLLNYMPTGKLVNYLLIGFFLAAFLKVPIIGAAIIGFALAFATYKQTEQADKFKVAAASGNANKNGIGEDE